MTRRALLFATVGVLLVSVAGRAAETSACGAGFCAATDDRATVAEPMLTHSRLLTVTTDEVSLAANRLADANITALSLTASNGLIKTSVTTQGPIVGDWTGLNDIFPYSGQHLLVLFQTPDFNDNQVMGQDASGKTVRWGPPGKTWDGYRWFIAWGWDPSTLWHQCILGYFDPKQYPARPVPLSFGHSFVTSPISTNGIR